MPGVRWAAVDGALDRVRTAPSIPAAFRASAGVAQAVDRDVRHGVEHGRLIAALRAAIHDATDTVTAIAALHAIGRVPGPRADDLLLAAIEADEPGLAGHALWVLGSRSPAAALVRPLADRVASGGTDGFLAQRSLAAWARTRPHLALDALLGALRSSGDAGARRRLVESIGLVDGAPSEAILLPIAHDPMEDASTRLAAVAAFTDRERPLPSTLDELASGNDAVAAAVRRLRRRATPDWPRGPQRGRPGTAMQIAQVHLGAAMDATSSRAGIGDAGGVATLLSGLGAALASRADIGTVLTIGRASDGEPERTVPTGDGHRFASVPLADGEGISFGRGWPAIVAARRGIRATFLARTTPDVVHLRMADPGTLAASEVAAEFGIPVVFTLAADPHGPLVAAERTGGIDRRTFAAADAGAKFWLRMTLVARLARQAGELVLFPRPDLARELHDLVGLDLPSWPVRSTVVAEGVDLRAADRARRRLGSGEDRDSPAVADLMARLAGLPADRHGLPLVVSVGRLNEAKGMARLVAAFATDDRLARSAMLVIVGGDLERPSAIEAAELARIEALLAVTPGLRERVVLLGHRPNPEVRVLLALARSGLPPFVGARGAYASASLKEEFGLAIVEALAAGIPVVAPRVGGPSTYVEEGRTGFLVDTTDPAEIAAGVAGALRLASVPETTSRARRTVEERYTLERMAGALAGVYRRVATEAAAEDERLGPSVAA